MGKWEMVRLGDILDYEQPTKYIVESTEYDDVFDTPVLTAGQSFILGYTNETNNIFTNLPVIIFDDFTTTTKFVDFPFKVKSSAMKILRATKKADIKFLFYYMSTISIDTGLHKRYWISKYADMKVPLPPLPVQQQIADVLDRASALIEKRKAQIGKLDLLVKSQFIEMFGDPVTNPKGWKTSLLKNVCTFSNGKAHEQYIDENGSFKLVTSKFIASGGELYRKTSDQLFPLYKGDICMVMSDVPNGRALAKCFLVDADNTYSLNQRICVFKTKNFDLVFLYHLLNRHPYFLSFNDGDSQTNLRKEEILNCQLILPSLLLQTQFADFVEQVESQKSLLQQSLAKLEQNYKSLMQKCFRGEIF